MGAFVSLPPWVRLFIIFQSGQEEGGSERSFNPFHLGFNPDILVGLGFSASLDIVIIIHHHHRSFYSSTHLVYTERLGNLVFKHINILPEEKLRRTRARFRSRAR